MESNGQIDVRVAGTDLVRPQFVIVHQAESVERWDEVQRTAENFLDVLELIGTHYTPSHALGVQRRVGGAKLLNGSVDQIDRTNNIGQTGGVDGVKLVVL